MPRERKFSVLKKDVGSVLDLFVLKVPNYETIGSPAIYLTEPCQEPSPL